MLSMLALLEVACPLAAFGGSMHPCPDIIRLSRKVPIKENERQRQLQRLGDYWLWFHLIITVHVGKCVGCVVTDYDPVAKAV